MRYQFVQANRLAKTDLLSARFIWMSSKETDEITNRPSTFIEEAGTTLKSALDIGRKYGNVPDADLPLPINTLMYPGNENAFYAKAAMLKIASYFNLGKDLNEWKKWIATKGPILAGLTVDATWMNAASTDGKLEAFVPLPNPGGHAVCVVGYTANTFIIRNSWGTSWGDNGFGHASHAYINDAFFQEAYGVTV